MTILKVYDTMQIAKFEAEKYYKECLNNGMDVRYRTPYRFEVGENVYIFVSRQAEMEMLGLRCDRIDDCTTHGIPARIRTCLYESKN